MSEQQNQQEYLVSQILKYSSPLQGLRVVEFYRNKNVVPVSLLDQYEMKFLLQTLQKDNILAKAKLLGWTIDEEELNRKIQEKQSFEPNLQEAINYLNEILPNTNKKQLKVQDLIETIRKKFQVDLEMSKRARLQIIKKAKLLYENQQFSQAQKLLNVISEQLEEDEKLNYYWGKLGCSIMLGHVDDAGRMLGEINALLEKLPKFEENRELMIYNKVLLLHQGLFLYFSQSNTRQIEQFIEMMTQGINPTYPKVEPPHKGMLTTVQNVAPHLVRYIAAFQFMYKNYQIIGSCNLKKFQKLLREAVTYEDTFTKHICAVVVDFDFEEAKKQLSLIKKECLNDFFLKNFADQIYKGAEEFFFEHYCKIYSKIQLKDFSYFFNVDPSRVEPWIVQQLKNTPIKAKISDQSETLEIIQNQHNYHDNIISKLKDLLPRTKVLDENIQKYANQAN